MQGQSFEIPLQRISDPLTETNKVNLFVLRTDLNHPHISGNKLFKLKYNLEEAKRQNKKTLITFGGAFSNHIAATAAAGKEHGFQTIGIIRGEQPEDLNPTLKFAKEQGMQLHFVSRELYKQKENPDFLQSLKLSTSLTLDFSNSFLIPEGAANELGISGCKKITENIHPFNRICCPCGTGTTLAGIILSLKENQEALGFQVLKGENYIKNEVSNWLNKFHSTAANWQINEDYHFGGYAKRTPELIRFVEDFEQKKALPLDYIYTGKMMYGIYDLMQKGFFKTNETVIAIHTGGLQGNAGFL